MNKDVDILNRNDYVQELKKITANQFFYMGVGDQEKHSFSIY